MAASDSSPTQEVERFELDGSPHAYMVPVPTGDFVKFEDHQHLLQAVDEERDTLLDELATARTETDEAQAEKKDLWDQQEARIREYAEANTSQKHRIRELEAQLQAEVEKREEVEARPERQAQNIASLYPRARRAEKELEAAESRLSSVEAELEEQAELKSAHRDARRQGSQGSIAAAANYNRLCGEANGLLVALQLLRDKGTEQGGGEFRCTCVVDGKKQDCAIHGPTNTPGSPVSTQQDQPEVAIEQGGNDDVDDDSGAGVAIEGDPGPELICPKCGSRTCGHGMEPVTWERFAELHPPSTQHSDTQAEGETNA